MSIYSVGNSAVPSLVGYAALGIGTLSAGSLLVGGSPIINLPGNEVIDFAASALVALVGGAILKSRDSTAAWLGIGLLAMGLTYAGWNIDTNQAGRMLSAAKSAAVAGATSAAQEAAKGATPTTRKLNQWELAWCDADDNGDGKLNRYDSKKAMHNCTSGEITE